MTTTQLHALVGHDGVPRHRDHVRSPVDVLRLIVAATLLIGGVVIANLLDSTFLGFSEDGRTSLANLPTWIAQLPTTALATLMLAGIVTNLAWALGTTRFRRFAFLTAALSAAIGLSWLVGEITYSFIDGDVRAAFVENRDVTWWRMFGGRVRPNDPLLAGAVAMAGVSSSWLRQPVARWVGFAIALYGAASVVTSGVPALDLFADIGAGLLVASLLLLLFGRHDLAPDRHELIAALHDVGISLVSLEHLDVDARGSAPWMGTRTNGERIFAKSLGRDERSADLMFRFYRWLILRHAGDHRPFISLRRAVEHEALVSLQAAALGVRTPRIVGVAQAGVDGMVLAYEAIDGRSADRVADISDEALVSIWEMVSSLHSKRIAHRDLRLANIFLDRDDQPWLIDFGFSEMAASDQLLGTDVAELLASTAAIVGPTRAVAAAHQASGLEELERALPWLQAAALSSATRQGIGGEKGIGPIRDVLIEQCGIRPEEPVKLQRVDTKSLFVLATLVLSGWFLIPQLADIDDIWSQVRGASPWWAAGAVVFSAGSYLAATASLLGAIPLRLRFWPATAAQLASSFANRVTPARVGGLATNIRYFQKQGVSAGVGAAAVGLNAVAGLIMHIVLTVSFLLLSGGEQNSGGLPVPSASVVATAIAVALAVIAVSAALPLTRQLLSAHVVPHLRTGARSVREVAKSPTRLSLLLGGSAAITLSYLAAMVASLEAFGSTASFPVIALLYLTGSALANAAPTPGGLGAAEAALIAALSLVESAEIVIPAVFLFRFVTFWLPILPGWVALTYLRRTNQI